MSTLDPLSLGGVLQQRDLFSEFKSLFTPKAIQALNNKTTTLIIQRYEVPNTPVARYKDLLSRIGFGHLVEYNDYIRVCDKVEFLGVVATDENLEYAIEFMIDVINEIADEGAITGTLAPLLSVALARTGALKSQEHCIVAYLGINYKMAEEIKQRYGSLFFNEGYVPQSFDLFFEKHIGKKFIEAFEQEISE